MHHDTDGIAPGLEHGVPLLHDVDFGTLRRAFAAGIRDFLRAPLFGLFFGGAAVLGGWAMWWVTQVTGQSYWLIFAAIGFPLVGPFAAVGLYEVSRRLEAGAPLDWGAILGVVARERTRQLPMLSAIIIIVFLFWFFIAHMIFALFLGMSTMTNVSTSYQIYLTREGLSMLAFGTAVGAGFAFVVYGLTVIAMPMLLDREVDFMSAMLASFQLTTANPVPMLAWAAAIAGTVFVAMLPAFLGLLIVLPVWGHASWHLYRAVTSEP